MTVIDEIVQLNERKLKSELDILLENLITDLSKNIRFALKFSFIELYNFINYCQAKPSGS